MPNRELTSKEIAFYNHYTNITGFIHGSNSSLVVSNFKLKHIYKQKWLLFGLYQRICLIRQFIDWPKNLSTTYKTTIPQQWPPYLGKIFLIFHTGQIRSDIFEKFKRTSDKLTPIEHFATNSIEDFCILCQVTFTVKF